MKEHFNKEIGIVKINQAEFIEMKDTFSPIKNSIEGITKRFDYVENRTSLRQNSSH